MKTKLQDVSTPVLVIGSAHHGALSITRTLGRLGVRVYNLDKSPCNPAFYSRYCKGFYNWDLDAAAPAESIEYLLRIARQIGTPCILAAITDLGALFIADHADALRDSFLFPVQDPALSRALYNKKRMQELAASAGVPTAATVFPRCWADVSQFMETASFPVMFKAADGIRLAARGVRTKAIVMSRSELESIFSHLVETDLSDVMLQEYIPGGPDSIWMFDGYFDEASDCIFGITARKLRQYPAYTGASSLAVCMENETVNEMTRRFMKTIRYRGVVDLGYRYDCRDGVYKIMDINPRVGSSFRLFKTDREMDVVRTLYGELTGQKVDLGNACWGRKWIVEDLDIATTFRYLLDRKLTLREWSRSLRGVQETAVWARDDWKGSIAVLLSDLRNLIPSRKTKLRLDAASSLAEDKPVLVGAGEAQAAHLPAEPAASQHSLPGD